LQEDNFRLFKNKMEDENLSQIVLDTFHYYYNKLLLGETGLIDEKSIIPIEQLTSYENLINNYSEIGKSVLCKSVIIKLNGGLGTSMGLSEAKSLLKVKNNLTFLDIIAKQAINSKIPLVLMNSFNTQEKSLALLEKYSELESKIPIDFLQHKIPKISSSTFKPVNFEQNTILEWCPPGHGDIYTALVTSGILDILLNENIKYAFISNADNLGAVMDLDVLGYFAENKFPFLMEVAERTEADKKGGHLTMQPNGQLLLRESAQCSKVDKEEFQNIAKHKYFNTNNIWVNLKELKKILSEKNNILGLPMIVNEKNVDPRNPNSEKVFQLETAMGSAISVFEGASALVVPRTRFAPVKTTEDLLAVKSDNYILTNDFKVIINQHRKLKPLVVNLDPNFYKLVDDIESRIPYPLSLVDCEEISIKGDYSFGENVKFVGKVRLENFSENQLKIADNTTFRT